jgi:hypothetical protein
MVILLAVYYAALAGVAWLVARAIPLFAERSPGAAAIAMLGALALICPAAWVYMRTKPKARYDLSLVHTLIVLPVVISGVVLILRDSVALAFSLAGIVAAVRFRNTLKDTKDAVYIFLAIAVGLAAGVQAFGVAFVVTVIFLGVVIGLWRLDVGAEPLRDRGRLIVETSRASSAEAGLAVILERHARRWRLLRLDPTALTLLVELRRRTNPDALVTAVRGDPALQATGVRFELIER